MIKGRRTRNAGKSSVANSAKPIVDDTASPKRKDVKYDHSDQSASGAAVSTIKKPLPHSRETMILRGGRFKTVDISRYLQPTCQSKSAATVELALSEITKNVDITVEKTHESFADQSSDSDDVLITNVTSGNMHDEHSLAGFRNSSSSKNNIFLQEPVLSLNFEKTLTQPNRTLMIMQQPFLANADIKTSLFSSSSQPKINSLWKTVSLSNNCNDNSLEQQDVASKGLVQHALDLSKPTQVTHIDSTTSTMEMLLHQDDSNSCDSGDSGVVILAGNDGGTSSSSLLDEAAESKLIVIGNQAQSVEKRKKPATPHRILCPSPMKHALVCPSSHMGLTKSSASGKKQRSHAVPNKSRKRLNVNDTENVSAIEISDPPLNGLKLHQPHCFDSNKTPSHEELSAVVNNKVAGKTCELIVESTDAKANSGGNKKITEFYPVRRSVRKTKKEVQVEREQDIERAIREGREEGLKIEHFECKGRGIVTTRPFCKGEFVVEYIGDLISVSEAKQREQQYAEDDNTGCYMYYFKHKNLQHCIDATAESGKLGRLVNHSRNGNLVTKTISLNCRPHLVLIAKEDIDKGTEVTYDYGDRSKEALQYYPWLAL